MAGIALLPVVAVDLTALHHEKNVTQRGDVICGIAIHCNYVGVFALLQ